MVVYVSNPVGSLLAAKIIWNGNAPNYVPGSIGVAKISEFRGLTYYTQSLGPDFGPQTVPTGTTAFSMRNLADSSPIPDNVN